MSQARDTVGTDYLKRVYAECLNAAHRKMEKDEFGSQWVKSALEDKRVNPEAVRSIFKARYGPKAVLGGKDKDANLRASEAGYLCSASPIPIGRPREGVFEQDAGLEQAEKRFARPKLEGAPVSEHDDPVYPPFIAWVQEMGRYCGLHATVDLVNAPESGALADCTVNTRMPRIRFNVAGLGADFFREPFYRPEQVTLVCHEFGHALSNGAMEHGAAWGEAVAKVAGYVASALYGSSSD